MSNKNLEVGLDLSGKTLVFDTSKTNSNEELCMAGTRLFESSGGYYLHVGAPPSFELCGPNNTDIVIFDWYENEWLMSTLVLPEDFGMITSICPNTGGSMYTSINDFIQYVDDGAVTPINKKAVNVNDLKLIKNYIDEKLKTKANKYVVDGEDIEVGMNLSGKTLIFDTSKANDEATKDECWTGSTLLLKSSGGYVLQTGAPPDMELINPSKQYHVAVWSYLDIVKWKVSTITLPDDFGTVTSISSNTGGSKFNSINAFIQYNDGEAGTFDCESNHNHIVAVDEKVDKLADNTAKLVGAVDVRVQTLEESMDNVEGLYREYLEIKYVNGDNIVHVCCDFYTRSNTMSNDLREIIIYKCGDIDNEGILPCHGIYLSGTGENYPLYLKATRLGNGMLNNVVLCAAPRAYISTGDLATIMLPTPESNPNIIVNHTIKKVSSVTW